MNHFIAYHKINERGEYDSGRTEYWHYSNHPESKLRRMLHGTIWVISGKRISPRETTFKLCSVFVAEHLERSDTGFKISGHGRGFLPQIGLNGMPWLVELLKEQGNFRYGLNQLRNEIIIQEFEQLRMSSSR